MPSRRGREALFGSIAGLIAGFILALALQAEGMMTDMAGLVGLTSLEAGLELHLLISALAGAGYGLLFRYQPGAYAATISTGVIYGLIWWILGPLTLSPLLMGGGPSWDLSQAGTSFLNLTGHILHGAVTGLSFYGLAAMYALWFPASREEPSSQDAASTRIAILGGGFGGVSTAQRLEQITANDQQFETILISHSNYLLFTPMLAEVASSALQAQHISAPVRAACPHTTFLRGDVEEINLESSEVTIFAGVDLPRERIEFDHLVLALGSVPTYFDLPGMEEHSFSLKSLEDASRLRNHVLAMLERADVETDPEEKARLLTFVVVGGGFAGAETIAELFDLSHGILHYYPRIDVEELRFVLVHSARRILPELGPKLGQYSLRKLRERGIEVQLEARAIEADRRSLKLAGGDRINTRTIVWTAGNRANPLLRSIAAALDNSGAVVTARDLRVKGFDNVWAVGDCASIPDEQGQPYPPTAQHALREGRLAAENIVAVERGLQPEAFEYRTAGLLVALGHRTGAAEIMGQRFSGLLAWLLWRGLYLSKLPGLEKKIRVSLDWLLDLFFSRDIVLTADSRVGDTYE